MTLARDTSLAEDRAAAALPFDAVAFEQHFEHRKAAIDGVRIGYVIGGAGPPVLLIHGWPETWFTWRRVMPGLADAGFTVIAPDLPGIGASSSPRDYTKHTAARLLNGLMRELGYSAEAVVARNVGGMVGYAYAAQFPETVTHLALIDTSIPGFGLEAKMDPAKGGSFHFGFNARPEIAATLVGGREAFYISELVKAATTHQPSVAEGLDVFIAAYTNSKALRAGFEYYAAMLADGRENRDTFRHKLSMPVVAIVATDLALPDDLKEIASDVRSVVVKDSGHLIQEERPVLLTRLITGFLRGDAA